MESIAIISIIAAVSALAISILTHIKRSNCSYKGFEVITTESTTPTTATPTITNTPKFTLG
jgi:hypothetical protein